ncbi:MAG: maturation protein [Sanya fiers-like virus 36]|nr:MAG: maturation protein [Sanya fiers-like virus 36]
MTIGNRSRDLRDFTQFSPSQPDTKPGIGLCWTKTWNGSDSKVLPSEITVEKVESRFLSKRFEYRLGKKTLVYYRKSRLVVRKKRPRRAKEATLGQHAYTMSLKSWNCQWTSVVMRTNGTGGRMTQYYHNDQSSPPASYGSTRVIVNHSAWSANDDIALLGKLREKVAGSSFNAAVFLGEGREALSMITTAASKIAAAWFAAKRGKFGYAMRILVRGTDREAVWKKFRQKHGQSAIASNWLELQYGWLPLLQDAEEGAKFLAEQFGDVPLTQRYVARLNRPTTLSLQGGDWFKTDFSQMKVKNAKQIVALISEKDVVQLSGLKDPLSLAWELLPYSFVADWFIPIGDYLSARSLARSLTGTFVTTHYKVATGRYNFVPNTQSSWWKLGTYGYGIESMDQKWARNRYTEISLTRTVSTTLSIPLPEFKPLEKVASWKHAMNAVALITQKVVS